MAGSPPESDKEAVKAWFTHQLDQVVQEMIRLKAVTGASIQATPVWMVPHEILIAKVWGIGHENDFIWAISIDKLIADYVAGSLAASPRDVARHFAMKWQMDADRILHMDKNGAAGKKAGTDLPALSERLIQYAESLYGLVNDEEAWQPLPMTDD